MAVLTDSGRAALAIAVAAQPIHLAWGTGDPAWDTTPEVEPLSATALVAEIGRLTCTAYQFVTENVAGSISLPTGRYEPSLTPTRFLHVRFEFDYADGGSASVREVGVFIGTVIKASVLAATPGKVYFAPADIQTPGTLLALQRNGRVTRTANTRQSYEFVLVF